MVAVAVVVVVAVVVAVVVWLWLRLWCGCGCGCGYGCGCGVVAVVVVAAVAVVVVFAVVAAVTVVVRLVVAAAVAVAVFIFISLFLHHFIGWSYVVLCMSVCLFVFLFFRSVLVVRLARAEDIPIEPEASGTYVDVHLLPNNIQSETFEPFDTSISVSFRESYEFPLSKNELAMQTLGFQIVRYDRFSRRTSLGEVFLALAELGAQGIDLSREVFLCRNIISTQQVNAFIW